MKLRVPRGGRIVDVIVSTQTLKRTKENNPIGANRVVGVDTESLKVSDGILKTVLVPYSNAYETICQTEPLDMTDPIMVFLDMTMQRFGEDAKRQSRVRARVGERNKGTRQTLTPVVWVFYNMEYDLQRLFDSESKFFRILRQGQSNMMVNVGRYELQVVQCNPTGSAPSFQIICYDDETKKAVRIYGIDMWGYWKTGLGNTAKALGVGEKLSEDVPSEWFDIPLDEWSQEMWNTFTRYAGVDAELTRGVYLATAELLGSFSESVFNNVGILPTSAPAAAARMAFGMASEAEWRRPAREYEQLALQAYHGGYVAMRVRGHVVNLTVADLHSAYPSAMLLLPDPCTASFVHITPGVWTDIPDGVRKHGNLGFVRATFRVTDDALFPAVSATSKKYTLHQTGLYKNFSISLPELSTLFDLGHIKAAEIHAGYIMVGNSETSFLRKFVEWFYEIKETEEREGRKDSAVYLVAKLLMNSLYGKLIEVREPDQPAVEKITDLAELIVLPPNTQPQPKLMREIAQLYVDKGMQGVFEYSMTNTTKHIETNPSVKRVQDLPHISVQDILQPDIPKTGTYFLPIHASLITAMTRAKIAVAMNCFEAVGGDTDSFFTEMSPDTPEWIDAEKRANEICVRAGVGELKDQAGLLGYGIEMIGGNGYMAGIKQYTLRADGYKDKLAHHAITDPPGKTSKERKMFCAQAVKQLATGQAVTYKTRKKPRRLRESLLANDNRYGYFVERERTVKPKEDERMQFVSKTDKCIYYRWKDIGEFEIL